MLKGFYGTYTPRMDDKGRLTLPAKYRERFTPEAMVVLGQDRCLYLFTPDGFEQFADDAINAPITDPDARHYQRLLLSGADQQKLDTQGRITIPAWMREYARLNKEVVITGVGLRMEIWDAAEWETYQADHQDAYINPQKGALTGLINRPT